MVHVNHIWKMNRVSWVIKLKHEVVRVEQKKSVRFQIRSKLRNVINMAVHDGANGIMMETVPAKIKIMEHKCKLSVAMMETQQDAQ